MIKIFKNQKIQIIFFILLIFIISFLSFWRAFQFDFWGEDWEQLWFAVFDPSMINNPNEMQHPLVIYEELLLAKLFLFNTFYWQLVGFVLKVLGAFSIALMMIGLTKTKKTAFFAGLLFASAAGGLASFTWVAAHASALIIPLICLGIYFWVTSYKYPEFILIKSKFILALILLIVSFWADPARGIVAGFIVVLWEIFSYMQYPQKFREFKKRVAILFLCLAGQFFAYQYFFDIKNTVSVGYNIGIVFSRLLSSLNNFLSNVGNLVAGSLIPIEQNYFAVSVNNALGALTGWFFALFFTFVLMRFFKKRSDSLKVLLVLLIWIPFFFFPNWLFPNQEMIGNGRIIGITHRYFTLSAVGVVCLLGYAFSRIKKTSVKYTLLFFGIGINIFISNQILKNESEYRSLKVTQPIWDKIEQDVPKGEENSVFFITGENKYRINDISQAKIPFAIRRNIQKTDKWPSSTGDPRTVKELLCGQIANKPQVPLSHLHAWYIKGNTAENISGQVRKKFATADCRLLN